VRFATPVLERIAPARVTRGVKHRVAAVAYPKVYSVRARIPRYSLSEQAKVFNRLAEERGLGDLRLLYWYHTVDLGGGLITPGTLDYRASFDEFHFPDDMSGMTVLDVGSATGFFAFEFEKRGAEVVSVEVPSLDEVDRLPGEDVMQTVKKIAVMTAGQSAYTNDEFDAVFRRASAADFYHYYLDGPFKLCHQVLGSGVERRYSSIYDIPETDLGSRSFDLVFLGDLLLHLMHPFKALTAVAPLCRGKLVLSQYLPAGFGSRPAALYVGGDTLGDDHATWWFPNQACFEQILRKLGFRDVEIVGRNAGVARPGGSYYDRPILHAVR